jgi:hypothetical protein
MYSELCDLCGEYFFTGNPETPKTQSDAAIATNQ